MIFIGIDDTDTLGSPGTGRLARELAEELAKSGAAVWGVTRHQLLVDHRIPFTSHNSSAAIHLADAGPPGLDGAWQRAARFIRERSALGSDPALCFGNAENGLRLPLLEAFGRRAQAEVLDRRSAEAIGARSGLRLASLGGSGEGVIGALAAVGLAAGGNDGRFLQLGAIRSIGSTATVAELLNAGVDAVWDLQGRKLADSQMIMTDGWVRPELIDHHAILVVEEKDGHLWEARNLAERRRRKSRMGDNA